MAMRASRKDRSGLTLVEVLIVITIIALLIGLLIPAVNNVREASRKTTCNSNLRQIALASVAHLELQGTFPSSGFGTMSSSQISGDRGFHERQGGSWLYNILPYIELGHLRDVGSRDVQDSCPPVYRCPTTFSSRATRQGVNSYAGSRGTIDKRLPAKVGGYGGLTHNPAPTRSVNASGQNVTVAVSEGYAPEQQEIFRQQYPGYPHAVATLPYSPGRPGGGLFTYPSTGVIAPWGRVRSDDVTDGMSRTFLGGERYDDYVETEYENDRMPQGWTKAGYVTTRFAENPPLSAINLTKQEGWKFDYQWDFFGARHAESCGMVMCDGSVRQVAFTIDLAVFRDSGTRNGYNDTSFGSVGK
jgi:prepilin-type N-terminal cleavage/methylation domain-containing protein